MVDKDVFLKVIVKKAEALPLGHYLDIRTYKRNRSVLLIREEEDLFRVIENGFYQNEFKVTFKELRKLFKKLLKIEFPRSHKIRIYNMGEYDEKKAKQIKMKKL
jgi:CRISPR/Cas system-associated endoribonuclease Cas2